MPQVCDPKVLETAVFTVLYTVTAYSYAKHDHRRSCWICGEPFVVDQRIGKVFTGSRNQFVHALCYYKAKAEEQGQ